MPYQSRPGAQQHTKALLSFNSSGSQKTKSGNDIEGLKEDILAKISNLSKHLESLTLASLAPKETLAENTELVDLAGKQGRMAVGARAEGREAWNNCLSSPSEAACGRNAAGAMMGSL